MKYANIYDQYTIYPLSRTHLCSYKKLSSHVWEILDKQADNFRQNLLIHHINPIQREIPEMATKTIMH